VAFPADIGTGTEIFSEPFTYTDGTIDTRSGTQWDNPLWTGQSPSTVVSNQLRVGPTTSGWNDCYSITDTFGDGDMVFTLAGKPGDTLSLLAHICAAHEGEGGVDAYTLNLAAQAGTDRIRLHEWSNGSVVTTHIDTNVEIAAADQFCIRRDGDTLAIARKASGGSWTQIGSTITSETTLTSGRIAFESNSGVCFIDNVSFFELPSTVQQLDVGATPAIDAPEGLTVTPSGAVTIPAGSPPAPDAPEGLTFSATSTLGIGAPPAPDAPEGVTLAPSGAATLSIGAPGAPGAPEGVNVTGDSTIFLGSVPAPDAPEGLLVTLLPVEGALAIESDTLVTITGEIPPVEGALAIESDTLVTLAGEAITPPRTPYGRDLSGDFGAGDGEREDSGSFGAAIDDGRTTVGGFLP
jgi:hypothetical protein